MRYFLICDNENNVIAIHKTPESARLCFKNLTEKEEVPRFIYLNEVESNELGIIIRYRTLATYSSRYSIIMEP